MSILQSPAETSVRIALVLAALSALPLSGFGKQSCSAPAVISASNFKNVHHASIPASQVTFLKNKDMVFGISLNGRAEAYWLPMVILEHRIANRVGSTPVMVTWCAWSDTGMAFRRRVDGRDLKFDVVGLRGGNMVLKDRETGSGWQQATGEALAGPLKGEKLPLLPFEITSWGRWKALHPDTLAARPDQWDIGCAGTVDQRLTVPLSQMKPEPAALRQDPRLPPHEMVVGLAVDGALRAYPLELVQGERIINDHVGKTPVLLLHHAQSDTIIAFSRLLAGRTLRFKTGPHGEIEDSVTGSVWNSGGHCIRGKMKGRSLHELTVFPSFWFGWAEFHPRTTVFEQ